MTPNLAVVVIMIRRMAAIFILVSSLVCPAYASSFDKGLQSYHRGEYLKALEYWKPLAAHGNAEAAFNIGLMYDTGRGVAKDHAIAAKWYRKAADWNLAAAQNNLAFLFSLGRGVARDASKALEWYRKAANQGYVAAQFSLGSLYLKGIGISQSDAIAAKWYRKAADQGYAAAQYNLGAMYFGGQGVERDLGKAARWYREAAQQGHIEAKRSLDYLTATAAQGDISKPQPTYALKGRSPERSSASPKSGFRVQLAAVKSDQKEIAEQMARRLTRIHWPVLDPIKVTPVRADLGNRGIYYRLRAGPYAGRAAAEEICKKLLTRKQACLIVHPRQSIQSR